MLIPGQKYFLELLWGHLDGPHEDIIFPKQKIKEPKSFFSLQRLRLGLG